jgi:hypothetical protein
MVIEMDANEIRQAAFAQAKAESLDTLDRIRDVEVTPRAHRDDGLLTSWSRNMPPKPPAPTAAEVRQMIRDALAEHAQDVDGKIAAAKAEHRAEHSGLWADVYGKMFSEERKRFGAEIAKLRSEHDLRISALLAEVEKLQRGPAVTVLPRSSTCRLCCGACVMPDPDEDRPLSAEAQAILRHAVVTQLRDDAAELAELCKEEPLPELPVSMLKLFRLLRRERDRSRRLLGLVAKGI